MGRLPALANAGRTRKDFVRARWQFPEKVNVQVEVPFVPERFHVLAFQQYGRVTGTDDHSIELRGVKRTDLNAVARPYWVTAVGPIKQGG